MESDLSDYSSEEDDEQTEADYEIVDDRSIKDPSSSSNARPSYANEWKSASSSTQSSFVFSTNIGPTAQFSKEKDAFLKIISDEVINM